VTVCKMTDEQVRAALKAMLDAAIRAADPALRMASCLPPRPQGRVVVVGAGKAAATMAAAVEAAWGDVEGVVVVPDGHGAATRSIEVLEASHPVPDARSEAAARRILAAVQGLSADDLVLALISGGGSALMALPAPGLRLADKQAVTSALLRSGATIREINCVRKHLSAIKGGRLAAAAAPARVWTVAISDVPGDDPEVIASGPTVPDPTTFADARAILARYGIAVPPAVADHLERAEEETPKPGHPQLARNEFRLLATPFASLQAAADVALTLGLDPVILGDAIEGEAAVVGTALAGIACSVRRHGKPAAAPCVLLSGGETTVTVRAASGRGGRNTTFLLGLALALGEQTGIWAIAADSDGKDGNLEAAGAIVTPDTLARARRLGLDPRAMLSANESGTFFDRLGDLVVTGPTRTNVNDIRAVIIV